MLFPFPISLCSNNGINSLQKSSIGQKILVILVEEIIKQIVLVACNSAL